MPARMSRMPGDAGLATACASALRGEVLFDPFSRGRYSTDASIYQIEPIGVALPRDAEDVEAAIRLAREEGFPVIARGGGSSQNGQTLGRALVMDTSRYMNQLLEVDAQAGTAVVAAGHRARRAEPQAARAPAGPSPSTSPPRRTRPSAA